MFHGAGGSLKVTLEFEFRRPGRIFKLACPGQVTIFGISSLCDKVCRARDAPDLSTDNFEE
jgi:hypothetical protein